MYLTERNLGFRLSYTEVNIKGKYPVLLEILKHKYNEVYFYSKEMLPLSFPKIMNRLYDFILAGGTIIFCIENIKLSRGNLDDFLMIEKLSLLSSEGKIENKISES
jgi:sporadic carbohydrate cluster protein (TIGR04323 family)